MNIRLFIVMICSPLADTLDAQTNYQRPWAFDGSSGYPPSAPLIEGRDGRFYGTTQYGGVTNGAGTVFKLNKDGTGFAVLHYFQQTDGDGSQPMGLVQGTDGALYGTTAYGGLASGLGFGTVFKLNPDGSGFQVLHRFSNNVSDGKYPDTLGQLIIDGGVLYGTTSNGGTNNNGTLFK